MRGRIQYFLGCFALGVWVGNTLGNYLWNDGSGLSLIVASVLTLAFHAAGFAERR